MCVSLSVDVHLLFMSMSVCVNLALIYRCVCVSFLNVFLCLQYIVFQVHVLVFIRIQMYNMYAVICVNVVSGL